MMYRLFVGYILKFLYPMYEVDVSTDKKIDLSDKFKSSSIALLLFVFSVVFFYSPDLSASPFFSSLLIALCTLFTVVVLGITVDAKLLRVADPRIKPWFYRASLNWLTIFPFALVLGTEAGYPLVGFYAYSFIALPSIIILQVKKKTIYG